MSRVPGLLNNPTMQKIEEPVALYFSYVDVNDFDYYRRHKANLIRLHSMFKAELIQHLRKLDYFAVAEDSNLAAHPATIVVSNSGIQTPFIEPNLAKEFAKLLSSDVEKSGFVKPLSKIFAIRLEQLPSPVLYEQEETPLFSHLRHPDGRMLKYIKSKYGDNLIDDLCEEAFRLGKDITPRLAEIPNIADLNESLYSGRKYTLWPYYSFARNDLESRYEIFATPYFKHAMNFSGGDEKFGLMHTYEKSENQLYYKSYMLELGGRAQTKPENQIETVVVPNINKYRGLEICIQGHSFLVPQHDERWLVFKEFCRAAYIPKNQMLKQRRINILQEAKDNGGVAKCYLAVGLAEKDLLLDNYKKDVTLEDVLIEPSSKIREDFAKQQEALDTFANKVREIRNENLPDIKTQNTNKPTAKAAINSNNNHR